MKDPVALAYSGRVPEARAAALTQASSDDAYVAAQGLEALAVLGQQHDVRTTAQLDALLLRCADSEPSVARKAFEAARSLGSLVLEPLAARRLGSGAVTWESLRYAGEWPSLGLARALAQGWDQIPRRLIDEALLTSCVMPVADREEARAWGERALSLTRDQSEEVRLAAFTALQSWLPEGTATACARALVDDSPLIRKRAAELLGVVDPQQLELLVEELGESAPEAQEVLRCVKSKPKRR
jgi:hypothetical protein